MTGLEREGVYSEHEQTERQDERRRRRRSRSRREEGTIIRMLVGMGSQGGEEGKASPCASM